MWICREFPQHQFIILNYYGNLYLILSVDAPGAWLLRAREGGRGRSGCGNKKSLVYVGKLPDSCQFIGPCTCWLISCLGHVSPSPPLPYTSTANALNFCIAAGAANECVHTGNRFLPGNGNHQLPPPFKHVELIILSDSAAAAAAAVPASILIGHRYIPIFPGHNRLNITHDELFQLWKYFTADSI